MTAPRIQSLVKLTKHDDGVALIELDRPSKRNALSKHLIEDLIAVIHMVEESDEVRVAVLTGSSGGPFSAGADLSELIQISTVEAQKVQYLRNLNDAVSSMRKPIIAAVIGFALGGGCELAMMCDIIHAASDAQFGFPEAKVGTIPGAGGTQRLARAVGKYKAMELILTGAAISALAFERLGVVSRTSPADQVLPGAMECARLIASHSAPVMSLAKQAILNADEINLEAGMRLERALYYSSFSLQDRKEGMSAFLEKRAARFQHC